MAAEATLISPGDVTVAILAGGQSSRFGSDKALAVIPSTGFTVVQHVVNVARQIAADVLIVGADPAKYPETGARFVPDSIPGRGPVGGVVTALNIAPTAYLLVLSCDQPLLNARDLGLLLDCLGEGTAAVFAGPGGDLEPLPVALATIACRVLAEPIGEDESPPLRFFIRRLEPTIIRSQDVAPRLLDADTQADMGRLLEIMATHDTD